MTWTDSETIGEVVKALLAADPDWHRLYHESAAFRAGVQSIAAVAVLATESQAKHAPAADWATDLARRYANQPPRGEGP